MNIGYVRAIREGTPHAGVKPPHKGVLSRAAAAVAYAAGQRDTPDMTRHLRTYAPIAYSITAAAVFLDSLRFKFTNAPETQTIFGKLDSWAASFGAGGLFAQTGLFSQYVIGSAELIAAAFLLASLVPALKRLRIIGALIAAAVMSGAVGFHLLTPLGIDPNDDGGGLFAMAVVVWLSSVAMLIAGRSVLGELAGSITRVLFPRDARSALQGPIPPPQRP
jgi:hypothetical protein